MQDTRFRGDAVRVPERWGRGGTDQRLSGNLSWSRLKTWTGAARTPSPELTPPTPLRGNLALIIAPARALKTPSLK